MSPTERSLAWLRDNGYTVAKVERWNQFAKIRQDLWGLFDLICMRVPESGITGIQVTSDPGLSAHLKKMLANPNLRTWLLCGNRAEIQTWGKHGARGKRKLWQIKRRQILISDVVAEVVKVKADLKGETA